MTKPTVLLIDDSADDTLLFERAIVSSPTKPAFRVVKDVESAQRYLRGHGDYANRAQWPLPRLIFLDLLLENTRGTDFLIWSKAHPRFKRLPIVVVTGSISPTVASEVLGLGANAVVEKPANFEDLKLVLLALCDVWLRISVGPEFPVERRDPMRTEFAV